MSFSFYQTATRTSPEVRIDGECGTIQLKGTSSPENVQRFFDPVFRAVDDLEKSVADSIIATFDMIYFNTGTSKCFFVILKKLKDLEGKGKDVKVNWYYEEDDDGMYELGEDYQDMLDLDFEFKEVRFDNY